MRLFLSVTPAQLSASILQPFAQRMYNPVRRRAPTEMLAQTCQPLIEPLCEVDILPRLKTERHLGLLVKTQWNDRLFQLQCPCPFALAFRISGNTVLRH